MRILVVDDDYTALALIEAALNMYGFNKVTKVASALEALALIKNSPRPFDCFLLDYRMPDIDGAHLCAQIRRFPQHRETPIIFVTALSDRSSINNAYAVGAVDYVNKPIEPQEIGIRVSIAEKLALEEAEKTKTGTAKPKLVPEAQDRMPAFGIGDPVPIFGVKGVVGRMALDNYIQLIATNEPDDFAVSAIAINEFEKIHEFESPTTAYTLIDEVAKVIADSLKRSESLISYNGFGEFISVSKNTDLSGGGGHARRINSRIARMNLMTDDGRPLSVTVTVGKSAQSPYYRDARPDEMIQEALTHAGTPNHIFRSPARPGSALDDVSSPMLNI